MNESDRILFLFDEASGLDAELWDGPYQFIRFYLQMPIDYGFQSGRVYSVEQWKNLQTETVFVRVPDVARSDLPRWVATRMLSSPVEVGFPLTPNDQVWAVSQTICRYSDDVPHKGEMFEESDDAWRFSVSYLFDRCLRSLNDIHSAYSEAFGRTLLPRISKEHFTEPAIVEILDPGFASSPFGHIRSCFDFPLKSEQATKPLDQEQLEILDSTLIFRQHGKKVDALSSDLGYSPSEHPFQRVLELQRRAETYRWSGDYEASVLFAASAAELSLRSCLRMIRIDLGGQSLDLEVLKNLKLEQVLYELQVELGGQPSDWKRDGEGPISKFWSVLYRHRNRISHAGATSSDREAEASAVSLLHLNGFLINRLKAKPKRFPRSLLAVLGSTGLSKSQTIGKKTRVELVEIFHQPAWWLPHDIRTKVVTLLEDTYHD
jgi:hypothetical protein